MLLEGLKEIGLVTFELDVAERVGNLLTEKDVILR